MNKWTKTGLIGTVIAAICCFTPALVWIFAAVGLAGAVAYLDIVLLPLLVVFAGITVWGLTRKKRT